MMGTPPPGDPSQEAIRIFAGVRAELIQRHVAIVPHLRACQSACTVLGWKEKATWLTHELNGYPRRAPLPAYRKVMGALQWVRWPTDARYAVQVRESEPKVREFRESVGDLLRLPATDFTEVVRKKGWQITAHRMFVSMDRMSALLDAIHQAVFEFASESYATLKFGSAVSDVWSTYRANVEEAIGQLGLSQHLQAIERDLRSENEQEWRTAAYACRSVIDDVANYLWRDTRKTYDLIMVDVSNPKPNEPKRRPLDVAGDKSVNKLSAYLHQQSVRDSNRFFVEAQCIYLQDAIGRLRAWTNEAHRGFSRADVESVVLATYLILGELAIKTDLVPVTRYGPPAPTRSP